MILTGRLNDDDAAKSLATSEDAKADSKGTDELGAPTTAAKGHPRPLESRGGRVLAVPHDMPPTTFAAAARRWPR